MSRPRIAIIDESAKMSGVEFSTLYLVQQMDRGRFEPLVICPEEGDLPRFCRESHVEVRVVPRGKLFTISKRLFGHYLPNPFAILANLVYLFIGAARLWLFLRQAQVDLVYTKGLTTHLYAGVAAHLVRKPCVWHVQDKVSDRAHGFYRRFFALAAQILADRVIADGPTIVEQMPGRLRSAGRVSLIYNGVDTEEFSPDVDGSSVREELGLGSEATVVGNISRIVPWKGQKHLLEAASRLTGTFPNARFLVVGSPLFDTAAYEHELREMAAAPPLAGRVIFTGHRWDLPQILAATDIFVYTAIEKDTSPLALVSAMAAGKPIIAPDLSGVSELFVDAVEGLLVPPANTNALTIALRRMLADADLRVSLGRSARQRAVRDLSVEQFALDCQEVFQNLIPEHGIEKVALAK